MPDYDGLDHGPSVGRELLLGVPRAIMLPLYAVSEYGLRAPIGAGMRAGEKAHVVDRVLAFFTTEDGKMGILPSAFFDFGLRPSVGFNFFWNDAGAAKNDVRVHFGTWGPTWINVAVVDRYTYADKKSVSLRAAFTRRQDFYFNGIGPTSKDEDRARYESDRLDLGPALAVDGWRLSGLRLAAGVRRVAYGDGGCCGDPRIQDQVARGVFPTPYHFGTSYTSIYQRGQFVFDTRRPKPRPGTGFRFELYGEPAFHPRASAPEAWIRYGGSVGQTVDLTGRERNLSLTVATDFADPLTGPDVPFNEQVTLGGGTASAGSFVEPSMRGFRYGRLVGRSAATATLQYTWPIWFLLEGVVQVAAGNVYGQGLRDFDADLLRGSAVIGVRTNDKRDSHFGIVVGMGTEPVRDGLSPESFRLAIGTTSGL